LWTYASLGAADFHQGNDPRLEFVMLAAEPDMRLVELVTIVAWHHRDSCLGVGHTALLGEPWLADSACDSILLSLPYPFGPELEMHEVGETHVQILWALPITRAERDFKVKNGLDALEELFDEDAIEFWAPHRSSVVRG